MRKRESSDNMRIRNIKNADEIIKDNKYIIENPERYKGHYQELFNNNNEIHLEIGMGKGDFIISKALNNPDINFIGLEKYTSIVARAVKKLEDLDLPNLKIINGDALNLNNIFEKEISTIYLNFSDPWPKARHSKRRLTSSAFLDVYKKILVNEGKIEFKTDNRGLFEYSLISINDYQMNLDYVSLDLHHSPEMENNVMTEYERKFSVNGPIYKMIVSFKKETEKG